MNPRPEAQTFRLDTANPRAWPVLLCLLVAGAAGWASLALVPGNVDVSWLLVACNRLLDGATLHVDVVEVNPPFSIWLYMPFAFAERLTGVPAEVWLAIGLPLFALFSVGVSAGILRRAGLVDGRSVWLAPATVFALVLLFTQDFGQREQFATIALLPWLALLAARDSTEDLQAGTRFDWIVAGFGAAMFVITKPPLAVPALALPALFLCFNRRSLRPLFTRETLLGAALTLVYLAWVVAFHLRFLADMMPMLRELYLPARMGVTAMLASLPVKFFAVLALATWAAARPGPIDRTALIVLIAALGYVPAFVLMGKGWTYQALPFLILGSLAFLLQLRRLRSLADTPLLAKAGVAAGMLVIAFFVQTGQPFGKTAVRDELRRAASAIGAVVEHPTIVSIGTRLQAAHPLTRMVDGNYRSRYPALWMADNAAGLIPAAVGDPAKVARLEAMRDGFIAQTASDIERERPDIILDGGSDATPGQAAVHANLDIARLLGGYRTLYRDKVVTVLVRSDLAPSAAP